MFFIERRDFGLMLVAFCLNFSDAGVAARCRLRLASTFDLFWDFDIVFMRVDNGSTRWGDVAPA